MFKKAKEFKKKLAAYYKEEENKKVAIFYVTLRFLVIICLIREAFMGNYHNVFLCVLTLILFIIPFFIEEKLKVNIPSVLEIIILLFIFSAEILGEIQNFYNIFPNWDMILHTLNGFLAAAIGFSLIDNLNRTEKINFEMSPLFVALVSFCFSMTVGIVWEFFEYSADTLFKSDMQKDTIVNRISSVSLEVAEGFNPETLDDISKTVIYYGDNQTITIANGYLDIGLIDTIEDLLVNFIGAITFSILGYFYIHKRDKYKGIEHFIPRRKKLKES